MRNVYQCFWRWRSGGDDVVDVMDLRWRRGGDDDVVDRRWLVMEEGDDGSGGGWPERRRIFVEEMEDSWVCS
ncbi:hypothetical protein Tco_0205837 [Tanacetum coccineum]